VKSEGKRECVEGQGDTGGASSSASRLHERGEGGKRTKLPKVSHSSSSKRTG